MELLEIFQQLNATNSNKDKEAILLKNKDNKELKELLEANLNPHKLYQFNKIPEYVVHQCGKTNQHKEFLDLLTKLEKRTITGNDAKQVVLDFLMNVHANDAGLYEKILLKEAIGVGTTTVNKVWKGLIPEFKLLLAPNDLPNLTQVRYPYILSPKMDGYRAVWKNGVFCSRSGKTFANKNIPDYFKSLLAVNDYMLDGELYVHGIGFNALQSILNTEDSPIPKGLKYVTFDCVPIQDWYSQSCKVPYNERLVRLRAILNNQVADYKKVIDVASDTVNDASEVIEFYKSYLKDKYEGVILRDPNGLYQWKRVSVKSGEILKVKPVNTIDLKVIDVYDGEGEFEGKAGGIILDYNGNAVRCGSGFDFATREAMAADKSRYIGKTAELTYMEITEDKSLRFPIFKCWRDDK